jgi:hypothetical protein
MYERLGFFQPPRHVVQSLSVQAEFVAGRTRGWFEVLVRHFLSRFFHNELLTGDGEETKRIMIVSYAVALPGLLVAMFLYPAYHGFPPHPLQRTFWQQTGDHYFYVMYALIIMGAATVYEWDLLFPDLLDVFVLSVLPIDKQHLLFARVLAIAVFLGLVLVGTSIFGILLLPAVAEHPQLLVHMFAHATAVFASGIFAAATFLALQGILINLFGENIFRRITPLLQGASVLILLAILLLQPTIVQSLQPLLASNSVAVRYFPPLWFLGIYESLLAGSSALPVFHQLAHTGWFAVLIALAGTLITYPLAYRRRVRQLIEGGRASSARRRPIAHLLRMPLPLILRQPEQRAIFYFISQTILRAQRQRVMLAMYGGLGLALSLSSLAVLQTGGGHAHFALLPDGIRSAVLIMSFWTVAGLSSVLSTAIDTRGAWIFRVVHGRPGIHHHEGTRIWVTFWAILISLSTVFLLHRLSPERLRTPATTVTQVLFAVGVSLVLAGLFLYSMRTVPFTHTRKSSIADFAMVAVRYLVLFPIFISVFVDLEKWSELKILHLLVIFDIFVAMHLFFRALHSRAVVRSPPDEDEKFPQGLGLRDS